MEALTNTGSTCLCQAMACFNTVGFGAHVLDVLDLRLKFSKEPRLLQGLDGLSANSRCGRGHRTLRWSGNWLCSVCYCCLFAARGVSAVFSRLRTSVLACVFSCRDTFRIRSNRGAFSDSWAKFLVRRLPQFLFFPPCLIGQFIGPSDREEFER
jgi:hypothetical protein